MRQHTIHPLAFGPSSAFFRLLNIGKQNISIYKMCSIVLPFYLSIGIKDGNKAKISLSIRNPLPRGQANSHRYVLTSKD